LRRIEPQGRIGFDQPLAQAVAVKALERRDAAGGTGRAAAARGEEGEQVLFLDFGQGFFRERGELLEICPIGRDAVLRQPVLEPERVAERVEGRVYGLSSNAVAAASCISSQRLASTR